MSTFDKLLFERTCNEDAISQMAPSINQFLLRSDPFFLLLEGDLGAGKTSLVRQLLYDLGLNKKEVITSPTFSLANEYDIKDQCFSHMDLYRLKAGDQGFEEFFLARDYRGLFVEWGFLLQESLPLEATHLIKIELEEKGMARRYRLYGK